MIPFGPLEPDRTKYAPGAITNAVNCLPVADGWSPMPDATVVSDALGSACLGAVYMRTSAGAFKVIAGTATGLFLYDSGTLGWTDVTRSSGGDYGVPDGDLWSFQPYGSNLLAANITDDIQYIDIDSGTEFAALAGSPPRCKYLAVAGEYLVMAHLASNPNRVQTSGIGDATYHTIGQRGADYQDFPDGEEITGIIGAEKGAIIFQRTKIRQMTLTSGGDYSFSTTVLNKDRGVTAQHSIAQIGPGRFVYYCPDGFFMGVEGTPIGDERVDRWFSSEIDLGKAEDIRAMVDPYAKIVWWQAERADTTKFLLGYRWTNDRWCYSDGSYEHMAALVTAGITIDGMDAFFATIDDADVPIDSRLFAGGTPTMAVFDTSHRLCYLTGENKAATLQTADVELNPGYRTLVDEVSIVGSAADYTIKAITSDYHGGARTEGSAKSPNSRSGITHMRSEARIHALKVEIPQGAEWTHMVGLEAPRAKRTGRV